MSWQLLLGDRSLKRGWFTIPGACQGSISRWNAHYIFGKTVYSFNPTNEYTLIFEVDDDRACPPVGKFYPTIVVQAFDAPKAHVLCSWRYRETRLTAILGLLFLVGGTVKGRLDKAKEHPTCGCEETA